MITYLKNHEFFPIVLFGGRKWAKVVVCPVFLFPCLQVVGWIETMFRGINAINMDAKGRMSIPKRYRQRLIDEAKGFLVVTIDTEQHCLLMYPLPVWEQIEAKIVALPSFHTATRRIQRLLIGHATELELDNHGRILLPVLLRDYAKLERQVILLGQGHKFEIWGDQCWQECRDGWLQNESLSEDTLPEELKLLSL